MGKKRIGLNVKNCEALVADLQTYYDQSVTVLQDFGGPSVYFHRQAIHEQATDFLSNRHIEMIYATLASWGMHRMGDPDETKAKMVDYDDFRSSILAHKTTLAKYRKFRFESVCFRNYRRIVRSLRPIYCSLKASISDSTLVAHSKTLAHILPLLLPPIDRQYTVRFFTQDSTEFFTKSGDYRLPQVPDGHAAQFAMFVDLCGRTKALFDKCPEGILRVDGVGFNTSYPKIMDNLIMAYVKAVKKPARQQAPHNNAAERVTNP